MHKIPKQSLKKPPASKNLRKNTLSVKMPKQCTCPNNHAKTSENCPNTAALPKQFLRAQTIPLLPKKWV